MSCEDTQPTQLQNMQFCGGKRLSEDGAEITALRSLLCRMKRTQSWVFQLRRKGRLDRPTLDIGLFWTLPKAPVPWQGSDFCWHPNAWALYSFLVLPSQCLLTWMLLATQEERKWKMEEVCAFFHSNCLRPQRDYLCGNHGYQSRILFGSAASWYWRPLIYNFISIPGIPTTLFSQLTATFSSGLKELSSRKYVPIRWSALEASTFLLEPGTLFTVAHLGPSR